MTVAVKTSFKHITRPDCEKAAWVFKHRVSQANGRSLTVFDCPWCQAELHVNTWSLNGSGKRCACGAIFGRRMGYRLKAGAKP